MHACVIYKDSNDLFNVLNLKYINLVLRTQNTLNIMCNACMIYKNSNHIFSAPNLVPKTQNILIFSIPNLEYISALPIQIICLVSQTQNTLNIRCNACMIYKDSNNLFNQLVPRTQNTLNTMCSASMIYNDSNPLFSAMNLILKAYIIIH